jgi:hypothetical protein
MLTRHLKNLNSTFTQLNKATLNSNHEIKWTHRTLVPRFH